ncbi:MAG: NAD-dependent DNA ligase LigA [Lachnospiraceae bacterium]|nr:NAD-dependent DNA ligase LigA [Lachnospiraceae bacterium]
MDKTEAKKRIEELNNILLAASEAYYNEDREIMSNFEYDKLYDELKELEDKFDIHLSNSLTQNVGYVAAEFLPKVRHEKPMLSLDKTKDREVLKDFLGDKEGVLSYKLDGLTIVLTYEDGKFVKGVTRGNGEIGEDISNNIPTFTNVPLKISYKGHLTLRGEAIITYSDFKKINDEMSDGLEKYKNPRNLCSGSVRQLDPNITKKRNVKLVIFSLVEIGTDKKTKEEEKINSTYENQLAFLDDLGFETVFHKLVTKENILETIDWYAKDVVSNDYPSDGLVLMFNDIKYGLSLGNTSKFPRNALAFKWQDETAVTTLRDIEWSPSRTGLINPVAIFDTVELEGTNVSRASLHNISIMEELKIGIGDKIKVFKANMIIPQVEENLTKSNTFKTPSKCPVCGSKTTIKNNDGVKTLFCDNPDCAIKNIKGFENFVSRNCMNIEGISIATIETFIEMGFIKEYADLYKLEKHKDKIVALDGFGEKSYNNLIDAVNKSRDTECYRVINSLGILGIGAANAKILSKHFGDDIEKLRKADIDELTEIDEIGPILAKSIRDYFSDKKNIKIVDDLLDEVSIKKTKKKGNSKLEGMTFVITGSLENYENRDELVKVIEDNGGKTASSVSKNTNYLINNDINSNSSKNKKAKELGVKIISEADFEKLIG